MENSLTSARYILVGGAAVTALIALTLGQWIVFAVLGTGVAVHTVHLVLHARTEREAAADPGQSADAGSPRPPHPDRIA